MDDPSLPKGQQVQTPEGLGAVVQVTGGQVTVKPETGETRDFKQDAVEDDSGAG